MSEIKQEGQNIIDVVLQHYGDVAGLVDFALINGFSITDTIATGHSYKKPKTPIKPDVTQYFVSKSLDVCTGFNQIGGDFNNDFSNDFNVNG